MRVILLEDPRTSALGTRWKDSRTTNFKLLSLAAILSGVTATPGTAQEAIQDLGVQAFYQSLGVGVRINRTGIPEMNGKPLALKHRAGFNNHRISSAISRFCVVPGPATRP